MPAPKKPSDLTGQIYLRHVHPNDPTKVIQLALVDTGTVTADNVPIFKLGVEAQLTVEDIQIGAVEIKDATSEHRASVNADGTLNVKGVSAIGNNVIQNATSTPLTAVLAQILSGTGICHFILKNLEPPTGGNIYFTLDGGTVVIKLSPGESQAADNIKFTSLEARGDSGGEDYDLLAWG